MSLAKDVDRLTKKVTKLEERLTAELKSIKESTERQESRATSLELGVVDLRANVALVQDSVDTVGQRLDELDEYVRGSGDDDDNSEGPETPADVFDLEVLGEVNG